MNNNLKKLRETLGYSQREFADKLKISDTTISKLEKGERKITDRMLVQICDTFQVKEEWFKNGSGEVEFQTQDDLELASLMGSAFANGDDFLKKVFMTFARLNDSERATIQKVINMLADNKK